MMAEWNELTRLTRGADIVVERVRLAGSKVAIEGEFELPPLACLSAEDQIFIMAFIQCNGSIKDMEKMFGISYPTVKNRLSRIVGQLEFIEVCPLTSAEEILTQLETGEINASEAIDRLSK